MPQPLPAVSLVAVPGRRRATLELARQIEHRGFAAIYAPSLFANVSLCEALAHVTARLTFGTAITPIYARRAGELAHSAAFLHEVSGGRFQLGVGVSHAPAHARMGVTPGKPLQDVRAYIAQLQEAHAFASPIVTKLEPLSGFYPAEDYHQDFLVLHPSYPYIVFNDLPKLDNLKQLFPDYYRESPVTVPASSRPGQ